jgi:hypothetical protein
VEDFLATLDRIFKGAAIVDPALVQELLAARIVARPRSQPMGEAAVLISARCQACPPRRRQQQRPRSGKGRGSGAVEEGEHGQHAPVVVGGFGDAELHENAAHVLLDRALGDPQLVGDAGVGPALGHEGEYVSFPRGDVHWVVDAADEGPVVHDREIPDALAHDGERGRAAEETGVPRAGGSAVDRIRELPSAHPGEQSTQGRHPRRAIRASSRRSRPTDARPGQPDVGI